ncbi:MAG: WecB/TagA/CpsF family glycosyltransferase [Victivallales bacterium]|nr:WecB/TagA/CpsF family glycosyltransferase [Victivallales bacterium]
MKLLVSCIPFDDNKSGISVYTREVVRELSSQGHELTLLLEPGNREESLCAKHHCKMAPNWTRSAGLSTFWHFLLLPMWIWWHKKQFDGFVICAATRRMCAFYPVATTATVHDLANFRIPGKYSRLRMFYLAHVLPHYVKKAQNLIAISETTKADMVTYWGCHPEDVTVLYNGWRAPASISSAQAHGEALLYISRIEHPGKNHVRLIEAYGRLPRELAAAHPLLLVGQDWKDAEAVHQVAQNSPNGEYIQFKGFVEDLEPLWQQTGYYVFPSLYEGFGLSLVEAMARGIPCACSGNGALGEVAGDVALTFDPENSEDIAKTLEHLLTLSKDECRERVTRGLSHIQKFSWSAHAAGLAKKIATVPVFGIPVARVTEDEAVEHIVQIAKAPKERTQFVATLNVNFVSNAVKCYPLRGDEELWGYLRKADFVTADGMPLVILSRLEGCPLPERVTGADLVPRLFHRFSEEKLSMYILGGKEEDLQKAFAKLPSVKIVGTDTSIVDLKEPQPEILERINQARPDLLLVALGNPKQELWMGRNRDRLHIPVMIGVGGTFNFIAGSVKRAPKWMQKCCLEWVFRIVQEPGRLWKRYAVDMGKFGWLVLNQFFGRRFR